MLYDFEMIKVGEFLMVFLWNWCFGEGGISNEMVLFFIVIMGFVFVEKGLFL